MPQHRATRRRSLRLAPVLMSGSALAACQRSDQSPPATTPPLTGPVALSFFNNWGSGIRKQVITDAIAEFQRQNPEITVTPEYFSGVAADFNIQTVTRYASGTEWDVGSTEGQFMANLRGSNTLNRLANITPIFKQLKVNPNDYYYIPWGGASDDKGSIYGMTFNLFINVWYYNRTLFKQEGIPEPTARWIWNDALDAAKQLTRPDKNQWGILIRNDMEFQQMPLIRSNGGGWLTKDGAKSNFAGPEGIEALTWFADAINKYHVAPALADVGQNGFETGRIGMFPSQVYQATLIEPLRTANVEWGVMPQPVAPGTKEAWFHWNTVPLDVTGRARDRGVLEPAARFVIFMGGDFVSNRIAELRACLPADKKSLMGKQWLAPPPANQNLIGDAVSSARKTTFPQFPGFSAVMAQYPAFLAKALTGEAPARDALTALAEVFDQAYSSSPFRLAGG